MYFTSQQNKKEENNLISNQHSLSADIATGWRPKLKIIGPMPLNFDNKVLDDMIAPLLFSENTPFSIVYLGIRPQNTFEMHRFLAKNYRYKYQHLLYADFNYLKPFFKKFYSEFEPATKRPFYGMNPKIQQKLQFDSCFESGNLDCVVKIRKNQYDLVLRVDANTEGHIMWFYFKVKNRDISETKVTLNIVNLRKKKNSYEKILKPYVKRKGEEWTQGGENVSLNEEKISFDPKYTKDITADQDLIKFRKLSFDITFQPMQEIEFAYSIPYTYSQLLNDIQNFKKMAEQSPYLSLRVDSKNETLSGLEIPNLIIQSTSENCAEEKKKYCIVLIGRQHPGQANGSYVLKGIIEEILKMDSQEGEQILKQAIFYFIPMVNPDGVVMGNFRTSLYGKDLNRLFTKTEALMFPEVDFCRNLMDKLSKKHKKGRLLMFLDIHGHSVRKNSFCYGPGLTNVNTFEDIRQFPKLISRVTNIFRYPSCSFRIPSTKKTTARAIFSRFVGLCYTIETSNWSYILNSDIYEFNEKKWEQLGGALSESVLLFLGGIIQRKRLHKWRKQNGQMKKDSSLMKKYKYLFDCKKFNLKKISTREINEDTQRAISNKNKRVQKFFSQNTQVMKSKKAKNKSGIIQDSLQAEKEEEVESEDENDSDDSEKEDMNSKKFKKYINIASQMFIEFEKAYYGDQYETKKSYGLPKPFPKKKKEEKKQEKREEKKLQMIVQPCFRNQQPHRFEPLSVQMKEEKKSFKMFNPQKSYEKKSVQLLDLKKERRYGKDGKIEIISSLPRISIIDYKTNEDIQIKKQYPQSAKNLFKAPEIQKKKY